MGVCQTKQKIHKRTAHKSQTEIRVKTEFTESAKTGSQRFLQLNTEPSKLPDYNKTSPLSDGQFLQTRAKRRMTYKKQATSNFTITIGSQNNILLPTCASKKYSLIRKKPGFQNVSIVQNNKTGKIMQMETLRKDDPESVHFIEWVQKNQIDHLNIVKITEIHQDNKFYQLIFDYQEDKNLSELILEKTKVPKAQVSQILYQMMQAISHLHSINLHHGNLKMNSFSYCQKSDGIYIKLQDLRGLIIKDEEDYDVKKFTSPECAYHPNYNPERDVWAIALIGYTLRKGQLPYDEIVLETPLDRIKQVVKNHVFNFDHKKDRVFREFLTISLNKNPVRRAKLQKLLQHQFIIDHQLTKKSQQDLLLTNLLESKPCCLLQQLIIGYLEQEFNWEEYLQIQKLFYEGDLDMDGFMSKEELNQLFEKYKPIPNIQEKIDEIFKNSEIDEEQGIDSNHFQALTASRKFILTSHTIETCFEIFSFGGDVITIKGLKKYLNSESDDLKLEFSRLTDDSNQINLIQFTKLMELML